MRRKLHDLETCYGILRHISDESCEGFLQQLDSQPRGLLWRSLAREMQTESTLSTSNLTIMDHFPRSHASAGHLKFFWLWLHVL